MKILDIVDNYLENPHIQRTYAKRSVFYPSQSSCQAKNEYDESIIIGSCLRSVYWEINSIKKTNPMTARGMRIANVGKIIEQFEVSKYKETGIWRANNVKFYNEKYNISGETDAIVFDKDTNSIIGVEIKTGYDYKFRKEVMGNSYRKGKPKFDHLLQVMLYINHFKIPFKMVYLDRGNAARIEFDITLNLDGTPNIDGSKLNNEISMQGCEARFKTLEEHLNNSTLPSRDFQLTYSKERVEFLHDSNRLNKTQTKEFEKNKKVDIGDWRCHYCDYKDYCWKKNKS